MAKKKGQSLPLTDSSKKDDFKTFKILWYVLLGLFVILKAIELIFMGQHTFSEEVHGRFSIMASKGMFIGFNVWAIILSVVNGGSLMLKQRLLFLISLLLLIIIFVYPFFTST